MTTIPYITHVSKETLLKKAHSFTIPEENKRVRNFLSSR
jgi:hypothetical protein